MRLEVEHPSADHDFLIHPQGQNARTLDPISIVGVFHFDHHQNMLGP